MRLGGQSASEFITSNAVALALIIILVILLFYIGSMNANVSARTCFFPGMFSCNYFSLSEKDGLSLKVGQATGFSIIISAVSCTASAYPDFQPLANPILLPHGAVRYIAGGDSGNYVFCNAIYPRKGATYRGKLCLAYTETEGHTNRTVCGDIIVPVN